MIRRLINQFGTTFYVQIWEHRIKVTDMRTMQVFDEKPLLQIANNRSQKNIIDFGNNASDGSLNPFSHSRSLLADFHAGTELLRRIFNHLTPKTFFSPAPKVIIHPMEKIEGGLTQVEERAFQELCYGAGACEFVVYQGKELDLSQLDAKTIVKQLKAKTS